MPEHHVVIILPHGDYQRGDIVTDPALIEALLKDHHSKVVKIEAAKKD